MQRAVRDRHAARAAFRFRQSEGGILGQGLVHRLGQGVGDAAALLEVRGMGDGLQRHPVVPGEAEGGAVQGQAGGQGVHERHGAGGEAAVLAGGGQDIEPGGGDGDAGARRLQRLAPAPAIQPPGGGAQLLADRLRVGAVHAAGHGEGDGDHGIVSAVGAERLGNEQGHGALDGGAAPGGDGAGLGQGALGEAGEIRIVAGGGRARGGPAGLGVGPALGGAQQQQAAGGASQRFALQREPSGEVFRLWGGVVVQDGP